MWLRNEMHIGWRRNENLQSLGWSLSFVQEVVACLQLSRGKAMQGFACCETTRWEMQLRPPLWAKGTLFAEGLWLSTDEALSMSIFDFSEQKCVTSKCNWIFFMGWAIKHVERVTSGAYGLPWWACTKLPVGSYSTVNEVFHFTNDTVHGERARGDRFLLTIAGCTSLWFLICMRYAVPSWVWAGKAIVVS